MDWAYPRRCGLCDAAAPDAICPSCRFELDGTVAGLTRPPGREVTASAACYAYRGRTAQAIRRLKYSRITPLVEFMARELAAVYHQVKFSEIELIVPVPIHWSRACRRGFNQSELIAKALPQERLSTRALRRLRATRPQVGLTPDERRTNLTGAFRAHPGVAGRSVLLVDDVITSGGTARECARTLLNAGATSVALLTFCSVDLNPK